MKVLLIFSSFIINIYCCFAKLELPKNVYVSQEESVVSLIKGIVLEDSNENKPLELNIYVEERFSNCDIFVEAEAFKLESVVDVDNCDKTLFCKVVKLVGVSEDLTEIIQNYLLFRKTGSLLSCEFNFKLNEDENQVVFIKSLKKEDSFLSLKQDYYDDDFEFERREPISGLKIFFIVLGALCGILLLVLIEVKQDVIMLKLCKFCGNEDRVLVQDVENLIRQVDMNTNLEVSNDNDLLIETQHYLSPGTTILHQEEMSYSFTRREGSNVENIFMNRSGSNVYKINRNSTPEAEVVETDVPFARPVNSTDLEKYDEEYNSTL